MYVFTPQLKPAIWGGDRISRLKRDVPSRSGIGESWELSAMPGMESVVAGGPDNGLTLGQLIARRGAEVVGQRIFEACGADFPLLVKIIDAKSDLSVQVHPDDQMARELHGARGKTEMWYVVAADPGARIYCGLRSELSSQQFQAMVRDNTIMDAMASYPAAPGDVFFVPAGRIHAIGAGTILVEVQQACDITYRVYDYGRLDADGHPRQLHTDLAARAIDFTVQPDYRTPYDRAAALATIAQCEHFTVMRMRLSAHPQPLPTRPGECAVVMSVDGDCRISDGAETILLPALHTALVPAAAAAPAISGTGTAIIAIP